MLIERGQTRGNVTDTSTIPAMVYVDEDGLEEQFLTEDEVSQEVAEVMANRVTTPMETVDTAPLDPIYTQRSQRISTYIHPEVLEVRVY